MTKKYIAQLAELDKRGYSTGDIVKVIAGSMDKKIVSIAITDAVYSSIYQAQRLIILNEHGTPIATYPNMPDTHCIDIADVRKWIDGGCSESVELEVTTEKEEHYEIYGENRDPRGEPEDYEGENDPYPRLTNNTVKMVCGEVAQVGYMQTVPNSHQYTLYGLQQTLKEFTHQLKGTPDTKTILSVVEYMLIGIENSIKDNKDILPKEQHPIEWDALKKAFYNMPSHLSDYTIDELWYIFSTGLKTT